MSWYDEQSLTLLLLRRSTPRISLWIQAHSLPLPPKIAVPMKSSQNSRETRRTPNPVQVFSSPFGDLSRPLVSRLQMWYLSWHPIQGQPCADSLFHCYVSYQSVHFQWVKLLLSIFSFFKSFLAKLNSTLHPQNGSQDPQDPYLSCTLLPTPCKGYLLVVQRGKLANLCGNSYTSRLYDRECTRTSWWWVFCSRTNNTPLHHHLVQ